MDQNNYILFSFNNNDLRIENNFPTYKGIENFFIPNLTDQEFQNIVFTISKNLLQAYKKSNISQD